MRIVRAAVIMVADFARVTIPYYLWIMRVYLAPAAEERSRQREEDRVNAEMRRQLAGRDGTP